MKKIISVFIITIILATNLFCVCVNSQEKVNNGYDMKKELISALGFYEEDFSEDMLVTRAMTAKFAFLIHNYQTPASDSYDDIPFSDITPETEYFSEIIECYNMGYMVGFGNGMFVPDQTITYEHFFKVMACCAGYQTIAENTFTVNIVKRLLLDSGLGEYSMNSPINLHDATIVLYNTLNSKIMIPDSFGEQVNFSAPIGETVLHYYFDIIKHTGFLNANSKTNYTGSIIPDEGIVLIDNMEYSVGNTRADKLIGRYVEFFVKDNHDNRATLVCIAEKSTNQILKVDARNIKEYASNVLTYYPDREDQSKTKSLRLAQGAKIVYNGRYDGVAESYNPLEFLFDVGYVELVDANSDSQYDFVLITHYEVLVVDSVSKKTVSFKYNLTVDGENYMELDSDDDSYTFDITIDGKEALLTDFIEYDVINIARSRDKKYIKVDIFFDSAEGEITEIQDNGKKIVVEGRTFEVSDHFYSLTGEVLTLGDYILAYCDYNGCISSVKFDETSKQKYGYLLSVTHVNKNFEEKTYIKIVDTDPKEAIIECREDVYLYTPNKYYGEKISAARLETELLNSDGNYYAMIMYNLDEKGRLEKIYLSVDNTDFKKSDYPFRNDFYIGSTDAEYGRVYVGLIGQRFRLSSSTPIFYIPSDKTKIENFKVKYTLTGTNKYMTLYNVDEHTTVPSVITIEKDAADYCPTGENSSIVKSVSRGVNRSGDPCTILYYYQKNKLMSSAVANSSLEPFCNQTFEKNGEIFEWYYGTKVSQLQAGDIIQLELDDYGEIVSLRVLFRPSNPRQDCWMQAATPTEITGFETSHEYVNQLNVVYGEVLRNYASIMKVRITPYGDKWTIWTSGSTSVTLYNSKSNSITAATVDDIQTGDYIVSRRAYSTYPGEIYIIR